MPDFNVRADSVNVEQIMEQIRARIREKRGVDYTEEQIRELASVKLETFLDPKAVRSDLLEQFQRRKSPQAPALPPSYTFDEHTLYDSRHAVVRWIRRLLRPVLKLFFGPNPLIAALHLQSQINETLLDSERAQRDRQDLQFEVLHNLVVEMTRLGIEVRNLKMRVESLTSRVEFNERRARALEGVVAYSPLPADRRDKEVTSATVSEQRPREADDQTPAQPPPAPPAAITEGPGQRSRRRRRRRGRRGSSSAGQSESAPGVSSDVDQTQPQTDTQPPADVVDAADWDRRDARPEPIEQVFGAGSHPAESTAAGPSAPDTGPTENGPTALSGQNGPDDES